MLTVSQPSVEDTTRARFGCFSFYYPELQQQLLRARLSPFNNRWCEPYNFTPEVGSVALLPGGMLYTELLPPLSGVSPDRLTPSEEPSVPTLCPVPTSHGAGAAAAAERCFLLFMPRCAPHALRWSRALLSLGGGDAPLLLRSREYAGARPDFCSRLLAISGQRQVCLGLYKIFSCVHEAIVLSFYPPTSIPHTVAILLHEYLGNIRPPPSTSLLYAIHHTLLVIPISCKGQGMPS